MIQFACFIGKKITLFKQRMLLIFSVLCIETVISFRDSSALSINILEDDKLVLNCRAVGLGIHLWYKDNKPIVTNFTNKYILEADPIVYSKAEMVYFTLMKLTVQQAKPLHTGSYKCSSANSFSQNVTVYSSAIQLGDHGVDYDGPSEVFEGQPFQISCELPAKDPLLWTINTSQPILEENPLGYTLIEREEGPFRREAVLLVEHTQLYQEGEYRCNRNSREFHYVNVIPAFPEAQEDDEDDDDEDEYGDDDEEDEDESRSSYEYRMELGETYIFNCTTSEDADTPVTWYKNGVRITERPDSNIEIDGRMLIVDEAEDDDAGEYMCIVEPQYLEKYIGEGRIFRLINPTKVIDMPDIVQLVQGDDLEIQCRTQGYPEPKITWIIGNLLASDLTMQDKRISLHVIKRSSTTLIIRNISVTDSGLYTCRAENTIDPSFPQIDEESVYIHVRAVSSTDYTTSTTYVQKGGKFILACRVAGLGVHLWYKDGKPVSPNSINKFHLGQDSPIFSPAELEYFTTMRLTVEEADAVHTGEYKCSIDGVYSQKVVVVTENMIQVNEDYPGLGKVLIPEEPLELICNTTECPHCTVIWFKDGEQLRNIPGHLTIYGNNTILIDHATYNDSGIYTCKINRTVLDVDLQATIVVQSKINLKKFDQSSVVVQGSPLELYCQAEGGPMPQIKWFRGDEELDEGDDERIKILDHEGLKNGKLVIEDADFPDRNHYTCEAYNQIDSVNTTIFIRVKDKLAALWPFLGICAEVAILCTIIFVYERRKSMNELNEQDTNLPSENKHRDQKTKGQDVRQRK